jgi:hypothetical protein
MELMIEAGYALVVGGVICSRALGVRLCKDSIGSEMRGSWA